MSATPQPPRIATRLIRAVLHREDRDCALSDLTEEFEARVARDGVAAARRWYRVQVARSIWPSIARRVFTTSRPPARPATWLPFGELRWIWRGLRTRGWRAMMIVLLFAVALAANAIVFAAADAFVFRSVPYHRPDRLVVVERVDRQTLDYIFPQELVAWREQTDLFAGIQAHHFAASSYVGIDGVTESVRTELIAPGLLEVLGVLPRWGRPFVADDVAAGAPQTAIAGERLARRLFSEPAAAIGQSISLGRDTVTIVGVMPAGFLFPTSREELWRPLNLAAWSTNSGIRNVARLADGHSLSSAAEAMRSRVNAVKARVTGAFRRDYTQRVRSLADARRNAGARSVFLVLVSAAICLLMIACANVASLEIAANARRARDFAIQSALGASRPSLVRVAIGEGAILLAISAVVGLALTSLGLSLLGAQLSPEMRESLVNPLDVDLRAFLFMLTAAGATCLAISTPAARRLSRLSIVDGLRDDSRTMPVTRGSARTRQFLMAGQVALTTVLLAGAILYLRTYAAKVGLDKGFDDRNVITLVVAPAPDAPVKGAALEDQVLQRLRTAPAVAAVARTDSFPPNTNSGITARLTIDDAPPTPERLMLHFAAADPEYFALAGVPIIAGRTFSGDSTADEVVIDERFAQKYWPDRSPIGARFRMQSGGMQGVSQFRVVGVSRQLRTDRLLNESNDQVYVVFMRILPKYHPLTFVVRLTSPELADALGGVVRDAARRSVVRIESVAERYARLEANTRLMASVISAFGAIALLVSLSGVYALMAYLVAGRSREIAIRMALGADRGGVRRLVLGSSLGVVAIGAAIGIVGAIVAAHALRSQFFGIGPGDPSTYSGVALLIATTALAAAWWPARRASLVDPAATLRD